MSKSTNIELYTNDLYNKVLYSLKFSGYKFSEKPQFKYLWEINALDHARHIISFCNYYTIVKFTKFGTTKI